MPSVIILTQHSDDDPHTEAGRATRPPLFHASVVAAGPSIAYVVIPDPQARFAFRGFKIRENPLHETLPRESNTGNTHARAQDTMTW